MQTMAVAIAISVVLGGAVGAGVTSLAFSYAATTQVCPASAAAASKPFPPFQRVPTTGSKGF